MEDSPWSDQIKGLAARLQQTSVRLNTLRTIQEPASSSRVPILAPLVNLLRQLANRLATRWYVAPILEQQKQLYAELTVAFDELAALAVQQAQETAAIKDLQDNRLTELVQQMEREAERRSALLRAPTSSPFVITLDYPLNSHPRYGHGRPPHPELYKIIAGNRQVYREWLYRFRDLGDRLSQISGEADAPPAEPTWANLFLSGLDAVSLYGFISLTHPPRYYEIGSGNSTRFARRAVKDHGLSTKMVSIDPCPRAEIDALCDLVIRQPLEDIDLGVFDELEAGDILFVDHSHRVFMNSDATVVFLDILPRLPAGIIVAFHDICLPLDYPPEWADRFYSEQYILATYLLGKGTAFEILLPCAFISNESDLASILDDFWSRVPSESRGGLCFWVRTT